MGSIWSGSVCDYSLFIVNLIIMNVVTRVFQNRTNLFLSLVIILIAAEILLAAINIVVDLYAGID